MFSQMFGGVGLGLLVGILVGLSSSPVASVVVGALAAGMMTLLGFVSSSKDGDPVAARGSVLRLGGFGLACTAAVLSGLYIRTHNLLSPTPNEQVKELQGAGYTPEEARMWVEYKNLGTLTARTDSQVAAVFRAPATAGSVLFASGNSDECQHFDTNRYKNAKEQLYALQQLGGRHAEYAEKISTLDANHQKTVLDSLRLLFCAQ